MQTIHKVQLQITPDQFVSLPVGAFSLCVQMQHGVPTLWYLVHNHDALQTQSRMIVMIGTGHHFHANGLSYIGTVQDGAMVWHFFERQ